MSNVTPIDSKTDKTATKAPKRTAKKRAAKGPAKRGKTARRSKAAEAAAQAANTKPAEPGAQAPQGIVVQVNYAGGEFRRWTGVGTFDTHTDGSVRLTNTKGDVIAVYPPGAVREVLNLTAMGAA